MSTRNPSYYDILGIKADAKHTDVGLAFNRLMAARNRPDAPPDRKGVTTLKEAFDVLSDLDRRAEYDEELRRARLKPAFSKNQAAVAALFLVAVGAGLYWHLRPQEAPELPGKPYQEILNAAIPAIGRLHTMEMSGEQQAAGLAFAVEEGVLVTSCQGLSPTAQLSVSMGRRVIPARVVRSDDTLGICMLEVPGAGSWPLAVHPAPPSNGSRVYAAYLAPNGEVMLRESRVKGAVRSDGRMAKVNIGTPLPPQHGGAPLLDIEGRVIALANMPPGEKGTYVAIPPEWREMPKTMPSLGPPPSPEPTPAEAAKQADIDDLGIPIETRRRQQEAAKKIDPQRRERLEKAFRPPPSVPDEI